MFIKITVLKANDIKTKKGVELLKHLVEYYHALNRYATKKMQGHATVLPVGSGHIERTRCTYFSGACGMVVSYPVTIYFHDITVKDLTLFYSVMEL